MCREVRVLAESESRTPECVVKNPCLVFPAKPNTIRQYTFYSIGMGACGLLIRKATTLPLVRGPV